MPARADPKYRLPLKEATTPEEVEAQIAADPDEAGMVYDWDNATTEMPKPKAELHMRVDGEVLDYFRKTGKGYQTRINAVLRSYVQHMRKRAASWSEARCAVERWRSVSVSHKNQRLRVRARFRGVL